MISTVTGINPGKFITFGFGPFLRYYFLGVNKQFNVHTDGSYQYNIEQSGGFSSSNSTPDPVPITQYSKNTFSIAAGPVIYFNTSVGLAFLKDHVTLVNTPQKFKYPLLYTLI